MPPKPPDERPAAPPTGYYANAHDRARAGVYERREADWRNGAVVYQETHRLIGFERHTDRAADMVLVLANPAEERVTETVLVPDSKLMDSIPLVDLLGGTPDLKVRFGLLDVDLPPPGCVVLAPTTNPPGGYSPFKRVQ